jgi:predicted amidohydrolase YtcJ
MRRVSLQGVLLCAVLSLVAAAAHAQPADTIVINGKILTVDDNFSIVEALAIRDERIIATGTNSKITALANVDTQVLDMHGATVIPGLIDNHFHFLRAVQRWHRQVRLDGVNSRARALERLSQKAADSQPGEWILVQGGWFPQQFADQPGGFTLEELDNASPQNPLFLQERYNVVYANSLALRAVGLDPADGAQRPAQDLATFNPPYGALIQQVPPTSEEQLEQNLNDFMQELNKAGLTGVYSLGRGPEGEDLVMERRAVDEPSLRIWHTLTYEANDPAGATEAIALIQKSRPNTFDGDYGLFGLGEHVYLPFFDFPSQNGPWPTDIIDNFMRIAEVAAKGGWHIHEHTMSNHSVQDLLTRFEVLNETIPLAPLRWTLAHVYDITPDSIARAKKLGLTLAVHGAAMNGGVDIPFRDIADSGIIFGLGTDATIVSHYQPFITLGWAVSGLDLAGNKALEQTLTREEALIAHTRNNAYLFKQETNLGSLQTGKYADLVVLDKDYLSIPAAEIMFIQPVLTMVGGRVVYRQP